MRNNTSFNKITIDSANRQRTRLPLAHDVNTTASIGDVQPLLCRQLLPKSNNVLKYKHLIRLDPMVAPTLARLSAKTWNHFVGLSDLLPRSSKALLTKAPISKASYNSVPSVPSELPNATLCDLAAAVLVGAEFTVYFHAPVGTEGPDDSFTKWVSYNYDSNVQAVTDFRNWIANYITLGTSAGFPGYDGANLALEALGGQFGSPSPSIPINCSGAATVNLNRGATYRFLYPTSSVNAPYSWNAVPLNSANYVLRTSFTENGNTYNIAFAVRLSAFGKRIRKILTGLGYRINFSVSSKQVDITPLFAFYKAYWDTFGLTLYDNWESSAACTLLSAWDAQESFYFDWNLLYFRRFIYDLGTTFVTESPDYISVHQVSDAVAPSGTEGEKDRGFLNNIILGTPTNQTNGVSGIGELNTSVYASNFAETKHVYINRVQHTEVDAELLKTLYKWTNRQTVAGKRIKELLEAGGYGDYVKECKSNFIGYNEVAIDISDINATADSTNAVTGKNSDLGSTVGKGVGVSQYEKGDVKTFSYETDELGYWVTLFAIVPESGWCQGLDPVLLDYDADHKYNPDFDGLGMELEPKLIVLGESDWAKASYDTDFVASFGMVPRHTKYKVAHNIINGDFSLRGSGRDVKLPFILDKYLNFGDREAVLISSATHEYSVQSGSAVSSIPIAGNAWRYLNRYKWLNNFERIFNQDEPNTDLWLQYVRDMNNLTNYELYYNIYDHFTCMNSLDLQSYARVLPVSDSYGTTDENNGQGDTTFTKA